ncbi:MAG: ATP-binding protein, partial [Candidatus Thorarchaeota archaeon]
SSLLFCIFLVFGLANSLFEATFLAILFALLTVGTLIVFIYPYITKKSHCAGVIERINLNLKKVSLKCEDYEDISNQIFNFEKNYEITKDELSRLVIQKEKLEDEINNNLNNNIPEIETKIKVNENLINSLKLNSKVETIKDYEENLALKKKYETNMDHQKGKLNVFGIKGSTVEENIAFWDNEIKKLEKYKDEAIDLNYSEEVVMKLKDVQIKLENQLNQDQSKYGELKENLLEIERNANSILQSTDNYIYCRATSDLNNVKESLGNFISKNKRKKEDILEIIRIFNEIEIQEKEKISNLLSKKSSVYEYFKEITDGLYEQVLFNMDTGDIKVRRKDNEIFDLNSLSGGAYDQLYFSIRLALAEKVLNGNTGFLILDDPFIKSDPKRLSRQINLLKRISSLGWQIIYFSCKDEILSNLKPEIENKNINFIELPNLLS